MILAVIEQSTPALSVSTRALIAACLQAKQAHGHTAVRALILGNTHVESAAEELSRSGVDEVLVLKSNFLEPYLALPFESAVSSVVEQEKPIMIAGLADTTGKDLLPRLAARFNAGQASDVLKFLDGGLFLRPMFAGNVLAKVAIDTEIKVVSIRATAFDPVVLSESSAPVRQVNAQLQADPSQTFVDFRTSGGERPELTEAQVVISGGRALKSEENFSKYIFPLADLLGAAIGASRAAVDSGYAPNDWQVGQTGKVVAPKLYIAVGISGAIQHLAGMKDSKVIVAINTDTEAPIFEIADYGLVGDLFQVLPELTALIAEQKGK